VRYLAGALVLAAGGLLIALLGPFGEGDDVVVFSLIAAPCIIAGAVIGRWPALLLGFLPLAFAVPAADDDLSTTGLILLTLLITVPFCFATIAAGVMLRKLIGRKRA
jgi:hypothetical protein